MLDIYGFFLTYPCVYIPYMVYSYIIIVKPLKSRKMANTKHTVTLENEEWTIIINALQRERKVCRQFIKESDEPTLKQIVKGEIYEINAIIKQIR